MEEVPHTPEVRVQYPDIASELNQMAELDQKMRFGVIHKTGSWDVSLDPRHTERMRGFVKEIGWPTVAKVGLHASDMAWLLVQHADHDPAFQQECLDLMKAEPAEAVTRRNIAMLEDRARVNTGRPQLYGTQFRPIGGKHVPLPIENQEHVDERRAQMGLGTLEEGIASMYKSYGPPKQA